MTTPLQQAAQEVIDRWESPDWHNPRPTSEIVLTLRKALDAELSQQVAEPQWTLTADKMPAPCTKVLACIGKHQPIRAQWVPAKTLEDNGDGDFGEYDEADDMYYWPEAWYETNENEEAHWMVYEPVTHWMPMPQPPQGDKP